MTYIMVDVEADGHPDSGANDAWRLDLELGNLDPRYRAVSVKVRPPGQIEDLPGNVFRGESKRPFTGKGNWFHAVDPGGFGTLIRWAFPAFMSASSA